MQNEAKTYIQTKKHNKTCKIVRTCTSQLTTKLCAKLTTITEKQQHKNKCISLCVVLWLALHFPPYFDLPFTYKHIELLIKLNQKFNNGATESCNRLVVVQQTNVKTNQNKNIWKKIYDEWINLEWNAIDLFWIVMFPFLLLSPTILLFSLIFGSFSTYSSS